MIDDKAEYWDALARRIAANAARDSRVSALHWLSRAHAMALAAALVFAAVLLTLSLRRHTAEITLESALAPADEVGRMLVATDRPPPLSASLLAGRPRG